jgi:3-oxoacyl-[acyl-carrier-protein] synthase II
VNPASPFVREPIAIVGIGCRFPGADGPLGFWTMLREGRDAVTASPKRWGEPSGSPEDPSSMRRPAGLLDDVDGFDWRAFRIPPREARALDPQHRLLLEVSWEALEDAGIPFEEVVGTGAGVFVALMWNDYLRMHAGEHAAVNAYSATGNVFAFAPGRVSYTFDLHGPSVAVDGACAGSLASVHAACNSLWLGESELCLAGGVSLMLSSKPDDMLRAAGVLSPTGHCRTLDAQADGFVRGEGAGIVVLKRLSRVTPADRVYALIRGSSVMHNGHNEWIMAASAEGQQRTLGHAYDVAGVEPKDVDYVELHGTGLPKGDPIEASVVGAVIGQAAGRARPCAVGSVKSNIGHLDSAAGIAGLIKVALAMQHREIPPTINLDEINPDIDVEALGIAPQRELAPWPASEGAVFAGVTAISMTGLNAHVVLEGPALARPHVEDQVDRLRVLPLSASTPEALARLASAMLDLLLERPDALSDIVFTASVRRTHHAHRLAVIGRDAAELGTHLRAILEGSGVDATVAGRPSAAELGDGVRDAIARLEASAVDDTIVSGDEDPVTLTAIAELYVQGRTVDWRPLQAHGARCITLPPTPWIRTRLWLDSAEVVTPPTSTGAPAGTDRDAQAPSLDRRLVDAPAHRRQAMLIEHVRARVAMVLGLGGPDSIRVDDGLFDLGMTSLSAVELTEILGADVGTPLVDTMALEHPTVRAIAVYLAEVVSGEAQGSAPPDDEPIPRPRAEASVAVDVDELTDDEAEELLRQRLRGVGDG